jgi:Asp/Glu/hydantoin racemase
VPRVELLVINPNTSVAVTQTLRRHVEAALGGAIELHTATARFGAGYIASEAAFVVAAHATLDAYAAHCDEHARPDAVLVGCFGDPAVDALREISARPVVGLAEAAMRQAVRHGRFSIVTGGAAWKPMLMRLARALALADALVQIHTVAPSGAELAADPDAALRLLTDACREAATGADCVILGGAGLAGMAAQIAPALPVPLIDSVIAGAQAVAGRA